jgi:hypothetical protein
LASLPTPIPPQPALYGSNGPAQLLTIAGEVAVTLDIGEPDLDYPERGLVPYAHAREGPHHMVAFGKFLPQREHLRIALAQFPQ